MPFVRPPGNVYESKSEKFGVALFEIAQRLRLGVVSIKDRQEFGDREQVLKLLRQAEQLELSAFFVNCRFSSCLCQKSQIKNLKSFCHAHRRAAFGPGDPLNIIHERSHQKNTATGSLQQVRGIGRIGNAGSIESCTLVFDFNFQLVSAAVEN